MDEKEVGLRGRKAKLLLGLLLLELACKDSLRFFSELFNATLNPFIGKEV